MPSETEAPAVNDVEAVPISELTDLEIMEERREIQAVIISLQRQLEQDRITPSRDLTWRPRAAAKLRHLMDETSLLGKELSRRKNQQDRQAGIERVKIRKARSEAVASQAATILEHRRVVEQEKTERMRLLREEQKTREILFVIAARKMLSRDQRQAIWAAAREMFPDDPCWKTHFDVDEQTQLEIRRLYRAGLAGCSKLSKQFGLPEKTILKLTRDLRRPDEAND